MKTTGTIPIESLTTLIFPKDDLISIDMSGAVSILVDGPTLRTLEEIIKKQVSLDFSYSDQDENLILRSITEDSDLNIKLNSTQPQ